jgi:hypothetical protein
MLGPGELSSIAVAERHHGAVALLIDRVSAEVDE